MNKNNDDKEQTQRISDMKLSIILLGGFDAELKPLEPLARDKRESNESLKLLAQIEQLGIPTELLDRLPRSSR